MLYKKFISFLDDNVNTDNELDCILYNIGLVQRIVEQFSAFYNNQIQENEDDIEFAIDFEVECNKKIHLALNLGDVSTLFVECTPMNDDFIIRINKITIAQLTLEAMKNG